MLFINNLKYNERGVLMDLIISAIAQGALWGLLSLGLFISFRVLNIADMTTEGVLFAFIMELIQFLQL